MRRQLNIRVTIRDLARWREQAKIERRSLTNLIELSVAEHIFGYRLQAGEPGISVRVRGQEQREGSDYKLTGRTINFTHPTR